MSNDVLTLINTIFASVNTLALVLALVYTLRQTSLMRSSIDESSKQTKLNTIVSSSPHYKDLNELILKDSDLGELLGETKAHTFAGMFIETIEARYYLYKEKLLDDATWDGDLRLIKSVMERDFLRNHWLSNRHLYNQEFQNFLNTYMTEVNSQ